MPVKKITKIMYECTCFYLECSHHIKPWITEEVPARCAGCKRRTWNRPARLNARKPLTFMGETLTILEWSKKLDIIKTTILWRLMQGWPIEQVLSKEDWRFQK